MDDNIIEVKLCDFTKEDSTDALCKSETYDMPINWTKENRPLKIYTDDEITDNVKQISENHSVSTDEAQKTINLRRNAVFRLAENVLQKKSW